MGGSRLKRTGWVRTSTAALAVVLVLAVAAATGCTNETTGDSGTTAEPIKVGAVLSLTGTYAALGTAEKNAIDLEVERINDAGGVGGRPIEVIIADDGTDEAKAVAATSRLIEQDEVVAILGASGTGQSMAMRSEIQRAGIPQLSMAGGTVITGEFDTHVFQTPWSNNIVVPFVLDEVFRAGHQKIAVLSDTGGYGKDGHAVIIATITKDPEGIKVVSDQSFNPGDADMSAQLTKIKEAEPDAVLLWTAGKEAVTVMKNAEALGLTEGPGALPFYGGSGQARAEFPEGSGPAAEGFVFGTGKSLVPATWGEGSDQQKAMEDFSARYEEAYGEQPDIFAGHAYDAVNLLVEAMDRADGKTDGAALLDALQSTTDVIGYGGSFTFTPQDHNGLSSEDLQLYRIEGGKWVPVQ